MFKKNYISLLATSTVLASGLVSTGSFAQDDDGYALEEILVTAQKRSQSANEVPMSINAFTGDNLAKKGIADTTQIAQLVPGMTYAKSIGGSPIYSMRGVGFNEMSTQASSTVGVYTDEIGMPVPIMTAGLLIDIERVEVLKGPQGTLYGRNSTGGAINYIAKKPDEEFAAGVEAGYASFDVKTLGAFINGGSEDVSVRMAVKSVRSDKGWQHSTTRNSSLGRQHKTAARFSVHANLGESTTALFRADYWDDKSDSIAPQVLAFSPGNSGNAGVIAVIEPYMTVNATDDASVADWHVNTRPSKDHKNISLSLTLKHDLTDEIELTSLTNYSEFREDGSSYDRSGIIGIPANMVPAGYKGGVITGQTVGRVTNDILNVDSSVDSFSQELRIAGDSDLVSWVGGLYYADNTIGMDATQLQNVTTQTNLAPIPPLNIATFGNETNQESKTKAVFASADWRASDDLTITTGIRYTENKKTFAGCTKDSGDGSGSTLFATIGIAPPTDGTACMTYIDAPGAPQSGMVHKSLDEDSLSYRLALDYDINDDVSTYASYTRGFKAGSFPTAGAFGHITFNPVVQERIDSIEVGFKATMAEGRAQLNGAIYHYGYTNKQLITKKPDPVFGLLFALDNVPKSKVKGAEFDLKVAASEGLTLGLAANYNDTEITQFVGFTQLGANLDFAGSPFPFAAKFQMTATADYEWELSESLLGRINLNASYSDSANTDYVGEGTSIDPLFRTPSYMLANINASVSDIDEKWSVSVWVKNLTNKFYTTNTVQQSDMIARYAAMPRTAGINLAYKF